MDKLVRALPNGKVDSSESVAYKRVRRDTPSWRRGNPAPTRGSSRRGLLHLTRASGGRWPGETSRDYYAALVEAGTHDPRDGFETLRRIAREGTVRANATRIRGGTPVVCWTARTPKEALELVRPRARFARWAMEPYGIWISQTAAKELGAREVVYEDRSKGAELWTYHNPGANRLWAQEREWRIPSDVDIGRLAQDQVHLWTATNREADVLRQEVSWVVKSFGYAE